MTGQFFTDDLFSFAQRSVRASDPSTSSRAAFSHLTTRATDRRVALAIHAQEPSGLTDFELAELMRRQQTSAGKRRGELRDLGLIEATQERRPAPSGSAAIVWRITELGREISAKGELL